MGKKLDSLLGRTFKSSKLKAVLDHAEYRIALLKCHRQSRYNHACSNVMKLLELRQTESALVRVEQVIDEQNMLDVFRMIEIYCQLLSERVRLIKLEGDCPEELKEAVTSLIYAASRCEDFPELVKISRKLTSRYGKEFAANVVSLPSNSGVSSEMVQKLSTRFPSIENRMKALHEIAYENNINLQLDVSSTVSEEKDDREMNQRQAKPEPLVVSGGFMIGENLGKPTGIVKYKRLSGSVKSMKNMSSLVTAASRWWNFPGFHQKSGIFPSQYGMKLADHALKLPTSWGGNPGSLQKLSARIPSVRNKMKLLKQNKSESNIVGQFEEESSGWEEDRKEDHSQHKPGPSANFGASDVEANIDMTDINPNHASPSGSINGRKKYRDAADAAQEAARSAADAAIAAKAALVLSQGQPYDYRDRDCPGNLRSRLSRKDKSPKVEPNNRRNQVHNGHRRSQSAPNSALEDMYLAQLRRAIFIQEQNNEVRIKQGRSSMQKNCKLGSGLKPPKLSDDFVNIRNPDWVKALAHDDSGVLNIKERPLGQN